MDFLAASCSSCSPREASELCSPRASGIRARMPLARGEQSSDASRGEQLEQLAARKSMLLGALDQRG